MADPKQQGNDKPDDIAHPHPAVHSDNEKSKLPERGDADRDQSPADRPGQKPGEGEPSVG
ncbi:hypothetical protein SCB29_12145 [Paraburkholderia sp. SIMBA_055]|uniref:hypothetical protein n=1 Tax=Paraburkholderia TaxID=1822464 RepID=UPI000D30FA7A|nr:MULTISPECIES: hypothetical protein [unclassified Paraburkholderia]PTR04464.1 hypothetical protein C8K19_101870 [Paraburkholderia sp. GV072]PUB09421.1 hypothetical protein C8K18_101945 [Paraburkholderia sp. GV068]